MEVYDDECLSRTRVYQWFKRFKEGRGEIEDDPRPGRPCTSKIDANIKKVGEIVRKNRCLSIRAFAELANID
jgi:transposase